MTNLFAPYRYPAGPQPGLPYGPDYWGINKPLHAPGEAPEVRLGQVVTGPNISKSIKSVRDAFDHLAGVDGGVLVVPWRETAYAPEEGQFAYNPGGDGWPWINFTLRGEPGPGGKQASFVGTTKHGQFLSYGPAPYRGKPQKPVGLCVENLAVLGYAAFGGIMAVESLQLYGCTLAGDERYFSMNGVGVGEAFNYRDRKLVVIVGCDISRYGHGNLKHPLYVNGGRGPNSLFLFANNRIHHSYDAHELKVTKFTVLLDFNNLFDGGGTDGVAYADYPDTKYYVQETVPIDVLGVCNLALHWGNRIVKGDPKRPEVNAGSSGGISYVKQTDVPSLDPQVHTGQEYGPIYDPPYYDPETAQVRPEWQSDEYWEEMWRDGYSIENPNARRTIWLNNDFIGHQTKADIPAIMHFGAFPIRKRAYMADLFEPLPAPKSYKSPCFLAVGGNRLEGTFRRVYETRLPTTYTDAPLPAHWTLPPVTDLGGNGIGDAAERLDASTLPAWAIFDPRVSEAYRNLIGDFQMAEDTTPTPAHGELESAVFDLTTALDDARRVAGEAMALIQALQADAEAAEHDAAAQAALAATIRGKVQAFKDAFKGLDDLTPAVDQPAG